VLRLVYSNRTEALLLELGRRVREQQAREGPLVPVRIVVPSGPLDGYVRLGIARACGVAANLDSMRLTRFAAEVVRGATGARLADAEALSAALLSLFLDDAFLDDVELGPVRAYVQAQPGEGPDLTLVRRVQLAARLGRIYEEYTYSRGRMLAGWSSGAARAHARSGFAQPQPQPQPHAQEPAAEMETWQRRLWRALFGEGGEGGEGRAGGAARACGLLPLSEALEALDATAAKEALPRDARLPGEALPGTLHVFGFAHFAPAFHELFAWAARRGDVVVYSLAPCEGFWEDVDPREPPPLHLWGRAGREHVRALNQAAGFDHDDVFADPAGESGAGRGAAAPSLLGQLQRDLLHRREVRESVDPAFAFEGDESLVILEHAGVRRELEAVASEIWRLVEGDASLRFDEIAVLFPDGEASSYLAHLPAVFGEAHAIPHRIVDIPAATGNLVREAVELLLSLPLGRFTRQEILRLAVHPAVLAGQGNVDPALWLAWCDELGVVHGADRADHRGTYIEGDRFNWDQGLRRLALGAFMAGDPSGDRSPLQVDGEAYVPHEVAPSELRDAAALGLLLRSLLGDAQFARDARLTMAEWAEWFVTLVETYVDAGTEADAQTLAQCLRRLHTMGEAELGARPVPYRVAFELARSRISALGEGDSTGGGRGVAVSRVAAMRAVPFRVVFACGLGEGRFPSIDAEDALDLRRATAARADVSARDRDKFAFLELMVTVRERLYLSYVSRDPLTGDALSPSSVVEELLHTVARGYVRDVSTLRRRHPLRRWDPHYFPELFGAAAGLGTMHLPEARAEARTLALRLDLERHGGRLDVETVVRRAEREPAWAALADALAVVRVAGTPRPPEPRIVVPAYALVKFLEFPLQGWARFRVGLDEFDEEDVLSREDEPFETELRDETLLLRAAFLEASARGQPVALAYDELARGRELRGEGPSGPFARAERADHVHTLETWRRELERERLGAGRGPMEIHRFGRAGELARADRVHDPVVLDVAYEDERGASRTVRVELSGRTLPLAEPGSITLLRRAGEKKDEQWARAGRDRSALRAFVDHAMLSAAGVTGGRRHGSILVVSTRDGAITERCEFEPLSRDQAIVWLRGLVSELLGGPHAYFLPCEAVFARRRADPEGPVRAWLEQARDKLTDREGPLPLRSAYGPVPRPHEFPIPDEETARALVARRFGALFSRWQELP
jgi:exodeoxyribonuclease V gamma subunit